jgi:hypothetical protein
VALQHKTIYKPPNPVSSSLQFFTKCHFLLEAHHALPMPFPKATDVDAVPPQAVIAGTVLAYRSHFPGEDTTT